MVSHTALLSVLSTAVTEGAKPSPGLVDDNHKRHCSAVIWHRLAVQSLLIPVFLIPCFMLLKGVPSIV